MGNAEMLLESVLLLLLAATLFHALRLERALGVLKRDRAVLEQLVAGFNESTRQAEAGVDRLRAATEGAGRQIARQIEQAERLRDDLQFLVERGDGLAGKLEAAVRQARMLGDPPVPARKADLALVSGEDATAAEPRLRSQAERDLMRALRAGR